MLSALLKSADGIHHKNGFIEPVNTKRESNGENIVLKIPSKRVFDIMLLPNSCYGYPLTNFIEIGKLTGIIHLHSLCMWRSFGCYHVYRDS